MTSLNPVYTVGNQLEEAIRLPTGRNHRQARERRRSCSRWWASTSRKSA